MSRVAKWIFPIAGGKDGIVGTAKVVAGIFTGNFGLIADGIKQVAGAGRKAEGQARQADVLSLKIGETSREAVLGIACTGGSLVDVFNFGGEYGTDKVTRCIALADHAIDGIVGFYVDDKYYPWVGEGLQAAFSNKLSFVFRNATPTGHAPPQHVADSGGWVATDRMAGIAHIWIDWHVDEKVWPQGHPRIRFVLRGLRAYDPRFDPQFGYSGPNPQTWEDRASHQFTRNAKVLRYAYTRGIYAEGHQGDPNYLLIGRGLSAEEAPPELVIPDANLCDEIVDGVARYAANGVIKAAQPFIEVDGMFAAAMAGVIVQREGTVDVEAGQAKATVVTITDYDLVLGEPVKFSRFLPDNDGGRINTVIGSYIEPTLGYQDHTAPVRRSLADIQADGGPRPMPISLPLVSELNQADRIIEIQRLLARLERRATIVLPPKFSGLEEGDWIAWKSQRRHKGATVRYRVESYRQPESWRMTLVLREIASSVFGVPDPVEDFVIPPPPPVPIDALQLIGVGVEAITLAGTTSAVPAIRFTWDTPVDSAAHAIRGEVRVQGETATAETRTDDVQKGELIATNGVSPNQTLEARLVPIGDASRPVLPSVWTIITTGELIAGDVSPNSPVITAMNDAIDAAGTGLASLNAAVNAPGTGLLARSDAMFAQINTATTGLKARSDAMFADINTAGTGLKAQTASLLASLNTPTTGVLARLTATETAVTSNNSASVTRLNALEATVNTAGTGLSARMAASESAITANNMAAVNRLSALEATVNTAGTGLSARIGAVETATANLATGKADASRVVSLEAAARLSMPTSILDPEGLDFTRSINGSSILTTEFVAQDAVGYYFTTNTTTHWLTKGLFPLSAAAAVEVAARFDQLGAASSHRLTGWAYDATGAQFGAASGATVQFPVGNGHVLSETFGLAGSGAARVLPAGTVAVRFGMQPNRAGAGTVRGRELRIGDVSLQVSLAARSTTLETATADLQANKAASTRVTALEATVNTAGTGLTARLGTAESAISDLTTGKADVSRVAALEAMVTAPSLSDFPLVIDGAATGFTLDANGEPTAVAPIPASMIVAFEGFGIQSTTNQNVYLAPTVHHALGKVWEMTAIVRHSGPGTRGRFRVARLDGSHLNADVAVSEYETVNGGSTKVMRARFGTPTPPGGKDLGSTDTFKKLRFGYHLNVDSSGASTLQSLTVADVTDIVAIEARTGTLETATANLATSKADASRVTTLEATINTAGTGLSARTTQLETTTADLQANKAAASRVTALEATVNTAGTGLTARIGTAENAIVANNSAAVSRLNALEATVNTAGTGLSARVGTLQTAVTNLQTGKANASDLTTLSTEVTNGRGGASSLNARFNTVEADVAGKAAASRVTTLEAVVNTNGTGVLARLTNVETVAANADGTAKSIKGFVQDVNGYVTGMSSVNDGVTSGVEFLTDNFSLRAPGSGDRMEMRNGRRYLYSPSVGTRTVDGKAFGGTQRLVWWTGSISTPEGSETKANAYVYVSENDVGGGRFGGSDVAGAQGPVLKQAAAGGSFDSTSFTTIASLTFPNRPASGWWTPTADVTSVYEGVQAITLEFRVIESGASSPLISASTTIPATSEPTNLNLPFGRIAYAQTRPAGSIQVLLQARRTAGTEAVDLGVAFQVTHNPT